MDSLIFFGRHLTIVFVTNANCRKAFLRYNIWHVVPSSRSSLC
jgi:hypothetical protein